MGKWCGAMSPGQVAPIGFLAPLGSAPAIARDIEGFALKMWQRYGDIVRIRFFLWPGYLLSHPDYVQRVLHDHHQNYDKPPALFGSPFSLFGNGLSTSNGEFWLHQRRLMQPGFGIIFDLR